MAFEIDDSRTSWRSWGLSALFHFLLLAALVLAWRPGTIAPGREATRRVDLVLADVSRLGETEYLETLADATSDSAEHPLDIRDALPISAPDPLPPVVDNVPANASAGLPSLDAGAMTRPAGDSGVAVGGGGQLSADELRQIAEERQRLESLLPRGEPATIQLFGSGGLTGRKFVFLLDRSKSMGSEGLGVLDRAHGELQKAMSHLTGDHQFQVVAYHHETSVIDRRALLPATPENRSKVAEFVQQLAAFGGTEHESALIVALAFKPDIIVMLTDGGLPEMNDNQLATIRRIAGKRTQIHCLQFGIGPPPQESFMQTLAEQNSGSYKYIDVSKW